MSFEIDKNFVSVGSLHDGGDEKAYWLSKSADERLVAIEHMRQILYGYDPTTQRLQRILEVAEFKPR
jgi:hypothetical protein